MMRPALCHPAAAAERRGVSLVEVLVAVTVLTIAMLGVASMLTVASRTATYSSVRSARAAVESQQLNRLAALPYDSLDAEVGCQTVSTQPFPHTRCVALTSVAGGLGAKQLRLIIAPLNTSIRPDTTYLTRSKGKTGNPLAT